MRTTRWQPAVLALLLFSCTTFVPEPLRQFDESRLAEIDQTVLRAISEKKTVGGVFWIERDATVYKQAYGKRAVAPSSEVASLHSIYDLASLTKVIATAPSIMVLLEEGKLALDTPVASYIPEFTGGGRDSVTVRHLLTHTSGLRAGIPGTNWSGYDEGIRLATREEPMNRPGMMFRYSDVNFILLGEIVRRVSGESLDKFAAREIFAPLGMSDTGFNPPSSKLARIAPTEMSTEGMLRGRVHDPTSRRMGGVAGHAGLFSTAPDVARYLKMILNGGHLEGVRVLRSETVAMMTTVQTPAAVTLRRGLGWDIDSSFSRPRGSLFPLGSFGHTGWTGSFAWIDPFSRSFYFFLSNRVHPDGKGSVLELQKTIGTLAARAIDGIDWSSFAGALPPRAAAERELVTTGVDTLNGIDVLARDNFSALKGLRIGLITNHTGRDRIGNPTIDLLRSSTQVELVTLFSPEHGIRGDRDEKVADSIDERSGLPVRSLYGASRKPAAEQLAGLDALVFDVQDIGTRFYTYISTMALAMEAAGEARIRFIVLDRLNPINGERVEGPVGVEQGGFVAFHPIALRHGMTVGELAGMFKEERRIDVDLKVIKVEKWSRKLWQNQTSLPWVNTSPNMRSLNAATLYPGIGLLETTNLSVGRGTPTPFEVIGAPYIDGESLAAALNGKVPGLSFTATAYVPTASVFKGERCGGVRMELVDRDRLEVVDAGIVIAQTLFRLYGEQFQIDKLNNLLRRKQTIDEIRAAKTLEEIRRGWVGELADFRVRRARYLLYE
ncbi:MAG TPA: exo-beta-N-acetylmuramidase NamZ domain-containing protein [Thermoanaerobaculia bacterium]|nr:exo-beta-N-acetylmuramidase NamZ domain-containing protein [Thermoanaerobaculia bacterium]